MALNRKIREEVPHSVLDLLRDTRQTAQSNQTNAGGNTSPASANQWKHIGNGNTASAQDPLMRLFRTPEQREQEMLNKMGMNVTPQQARQNMRTTYNIGGVETSLRGQGKPVKWEDLNSMQRAEFNYWDPQHKIYNVESDTNFSPVNNRPTIYTDRETGEKKLFWDTRNPDAVRHLEQQNKDKLLENVLEGKYNDRDPQKDLEAGQGARALYENFHGTPQYAGATRFIAMNGGGSLTPDEQNKMIQQMLGRQSSQNVDSMTNQWDNEALEARRQNFRANNTTTMDPVAYRDQLINEGVYQPNAANGMQRINKEFGLVDERYNLANGNKDPLEATYDWFRDVPRNFNTMIGNFNTVFGDKQGNPNDSKWVKDYFANELHKGGYHWQDLYNDFTYEPPGGTSFAKQFLNTDIGRNFVYYRYGGNSQEAYEKAAADKDLFNLYLGVADLAMNNPGKNADQKKKDAWNKQVEGLLDLYVFGYTAALRNANLSEITGNLQNTTVEQGKRQAVMNNIDTAVNRINKGHFQASTAFTMNGIANYARAGLYEEASLRYNQTIVSLRDNMDEMTAMLNLAEQYLGKDSQQYKDTKKALDLLNDNYQQVLDYGVMFRPDFAQNSQAARPANALGAFGDRFGAEHIQGHWKEVNEPDVQRGTEHYTEGMNSDILGDVGRYLTDEQVAIYNYYYNTEGWERADKYLEGLTDYLNVNRSQAIRMKAEWDAEHNPIGTMVGEILAVPVNGILGVAGAAAGASPYDPIFGTGAWSQTAEQAIRDQWEEAMPGWGGTFFQIVDQTAKSTYTMALGKTLGSMMGIPANSAFVKVAGITPQSAAGASIKYRQEYERTGNTNYAQAAASLSFLMEASTEFVGMEWTMSHISANTLFGSYVRSFICGGIAEGLEEIPGAIADIAFDLWYDQNESAIRAEIAQREQAYIGAGMDPNKAAGQAAKDVWTKRAQEALNEVFVAAASGGMSNMAYNAMGIYSPEGIANYHSRVQNALEAGAITEQQAQMINGYVDEMQILANNGEENVGQAMMNRHGDFYVSQELPEAMEAMHEYELKQEANERMEKSGLTDDYFMEAAGNMLGQLEVARGGDQVEADEQDAENRQFNNAMAAANQAQDIRLPAAEEAPIQSNGLRMGAIPQQTIDNIEQTQAAQSFNDSMAASRNVEDTRLPEEEEKQPKQKPGKLPRSVRKAMKEAEKARADAVKSFNRAQALQKDIEQVQMQIRSLEEQQDLDAQGSLNNTQEIANLSQRFSQLTQEWQELIREGNASQARAQELDAQAQRLTDENNPVAEQKAQRPNVPTMEQAKQEQAPAQVPTIQMAQPAQETQPAEEAQQPVEEAPADVPQDNHSENIPEKLPMPKNLPKRRKPRITQEELATFLKARQGMAVLTPQQAEDLTDKYSELMYFFDNKPFGTDVRIGKQNVKIDGFASSGADATVNITVPGRKGKPVTQTVKLDDVDFGDHIGVQYAYEHAAAYSDVNTAKNYLAGYERTAADPYNYNRAFEGIFSSALNGTQMTDAQKASANMLEEGVRSLIQQAGQRARSQMAEELGIDGEANSDMTKAEQGIARAGTEEANSRTYTGVVRDFSGKMNAKQRANMHALHWIAKNAGMKITLTDKAGRYLTRKGSIDENAGLNGFFRTGTNEAVIDIHAMDGAAVITAFHEAWHFVKQEAKNSPELAENVSKIEGILEKHLNSLPNYNRAQRIQEVQALYKEAGQNLTEDEALEEIYADALRGVADRGLITQFKNATGTQTVLDKIRSVLDKWKGYLNKAVRSLGESNPEVRAVLQAKEDILAQLSNNFRATREIAGRVYAERTKGNDNVEAQGVRYSRKGDAESEAIRVSILKNINNIKEKGILERISSKIDFSSYFKNGAMDVTAAHRSWAKDFAKSIGMAVTREGVGKVTFSNSNISGGFAYISASNIWRVAAFKAVPTIIRDGVEVYLEPNQKGRGYESRVFAGYIEMDGDPAYMGVVVHYDGRSRTYHTHKVLFEDGSEFILDQKETEDGTRAEHFSNDGAQTAHASSVYGDIIQQNSDYVKQKQLEIIKNSNPMRDDYHRGIRTVDDIMTWEEAVNDKDIDEKLVYPDFSMEDAKKALETGRIKVFSSKKIEPGVFVATSRRMAEDYSGTKRIFTKIVRTSDVAWNGVDEGQYAKVEEQETETEKPEVVTNSQGEELAGTLPGGTVAKYSLTSWNETDIGKLNTFLKKQGYTEKEIDKWISDVNSIAAIIAADPTRLDFKADRKKNSFKRPNGDIYKWTIDASTLCAKRLWYQGTFNAIQKQLPNTALLPEDLINLSNIMSEMGYQTPCGICYLESKRKLIGKFTEEFLANYKGRNGFMPTYADLTTSDGLARLKEEHNDVYMDFIRANNRRGSGSVKPVMLRTDYRGEIRRMSKNTIKYLNSIGGLRIQSFSDFETPHLLDMMQVVIDMAGMHLKSQAYTKVPNFAWVFGGTGIKINLSLMGEGKGVDENGKLIFSSKEGMDFDEAMKIRDRYGDNVGTILVGMNDAHILAAMADDRIDFIIPFHKSGWSKNDMQLMHSMQNYEDYTDYQNERIIQGYTKEGKPDYKNVEENLDPYGENGYWNYKRTGKQNAEHYLELCAKNGIVPKFNNFLVDNGDGSYSLQPDGSTDGYWKLLIDFKMYNNNGKGVPQQEVRPNVNMEEAERVLKEFDGTGLNSLPVAQNVVDRFVREYKSARPNEARFSLADRQYENAVKNGDTALADQMVERAARRAGYTLKVTHRTNAKFNVFDKTKRSGKNGKSLGDGFYVAELKDGRRSEYDSDAYGKIRIVAYVDPGNVFNLAKGLSEEQAEYVYDKYFAPFHEDRFGTYKPHVIDKLQSSTRLMDYIIEAAETNNTTTDEIFKDLGYDSIKDGPQYAIFDSEQIKRADTATYDDDGELIQLSERFNRENPDIRYSLSDPAVEEAADGIRWSFGTELTDEDGNAEMAQLLKDNERLQAENQRLRNGVEVATALNENRQMRELMQQVTAQINQWRGEEPDARQIARMARDVREALETTVPYEDLKQDLANAFKTMSRARTPLEAKAAMQALSDLMLHCANNSRHTDKSDYEQYADERATIKSVSPRAWKEICADVGMEWSYFRQKWGPKLGWIKNRRTLRDDGASIDSAWQELNEMNPGTFSDDTLALGDKAAAMLAFMEQTAIHYYNPHKAENPMNQGMDTATYAASDMAMKLLYDYMTNGHEVQGSDQRRMARITELMDQTMTAIRENRGKSETPAPASWQKKMDEMKQRIRQERSAGFQRAREARADERARQQDIRMRQAERRAEMEDRRKTVGEINRKRASLLKKLEHPSSSGWVPTAMRDSVTKLLTALDFENEITGEQAFTEDLLKEAKAAYESINKGEGPDGARGPMASYYNGDLVNTFDKLIETAAGKKASQLTDEEMSEIRDIVSGFAAAVINADTMFTTARSESVHDMGDTMIEQSNERRNRLGEHRVQGKMGQWLSTALSRGLLKPTTVYGEYEGTVIGDIYKRLRAAEFQHIRNVTEAEEFFQDLINKYHMQSVVNQESSEGRSRHLDRIRRHSKSFRLSSGQTVNLTTQELMTLYAWQKREGIMETNHLLGGGFTLRNQAKGGSTAEYRVNSGDLAQFNAALTEDQKKFVDEMVKYLSTTVGGWGNEVTEILYGLSKFTESYYLPFTVNKNYVGQDPAQAQDARIKVASFTKDLTRNASTTLELAPFMTLWASHVEQMSDFNAFTLPIEDMVRVMNYRQSLYDDEGKFAGYGESVRPRMQQAWGRNSTDYIYSFLARLNGNSRQEHGGSWINRFMGTAKGAAVTFNLSVAAQQMGAGIRAMAEMNPIDVAKGIVKGLNVVRLNKQYEELMQYAPIAIEKSWGYFDTNMKSGLYDRQRKTAWNWIEDKGGKLAEFGDMFNWVQIWQACKSEARRQNKGADAETIKQKAGERFAEVIDRTQVVDSVFQRAEWATEKGMMKNLMAFMSEPITMYNMLYRSATEFGRALKTKEGGVKAFGKLTRNVAAIGMSGALTALLKSLITGLRNRDNEKKDKDGNIIGRKTYGDKVLESWGGNMIDNLLGVGTVFSSAIQDVAGTYRSSNSLTDAWIGNLYDAGKELIKGLDGTSEPNYEKAFYKALQGVSSLCGVGFASLYRDSKALIDTAKEEFTDMMVAADAYDDSKSLEERLSVATQTMAYTDDHKGPGMKKKPGFYTDLLLDVYLKHGLGAEFEQVADAAISVGATAKGLQTSFRNKLSAAEDRVPAAAKAMADGDTETYNRLVHELLEYGIGSKIINSMIESEYKKLVNTEEEPKEPGTGEDLIGKLKEGDEGTSLLTTRADNLLDNLSTRDQVKEAVSLYKQDGLSEDKIAGKLSGKYKNSYIAACINGDTSEQKRLQQLLTTEGGGITVADLKKWTSDDLFDSSSKNGLYYHILNGDTDTAKKTAQWLYRNVEGGQQTVKDKVTKWAKNRNSRGTATDWQTVRAVLKAMGFSQDTIDKCCGK